MSNLNKKRIIITSIFLGIFLIGTILIFTTPTSIKITYSLTAQTVDNETISFNVFEPVNGDEKMKAVIIGHGIIVNKETLKGYAIELACAGFLTAVIDFRGHGQSSGELIIDPLINDIRAVKGYLESRADVDSNNCAYIGYSMGGFPGNQIVKEDDDFKCFIGVGTSLAIEKADISPGRKLNILMIKGEYDQAFATSDLKEQFGKLIEKAPEDVVVNRLYGCFETGNAAKIFLDDNSDHLTTAWDQDFVREARDWVMNTFHDVDPVDQHFYVNIRFIILIIQLIGGIGFFFLIIKPVSGLLIKKREEAPVIPELDDESLSNLTKKLTLYTLIYFIPGLGLMIPVLLFLPLMTAGLMTMLLFGQAFGMLMFLWRYGKKKGVNLLVLLKQPFKSSKDSLIRNIILGSILAILLYIILYLSLGLNYLGMAPSITKWLWIIPYFIVMFFIFMIYHVIFNIIFQSKIGYERKEIIKGTLFAFTMLYGYLFLLILIPCIMIGNFFLAMFLEVAVFIHLLLVSVSAMLYERTGSIIPASIVNTLYLILLLATLSPFMNMLGFLQVATSILSH